MAFDAYQISRESTDILIDNCDIFGCGTEGIDIFSSCSVTVRNSVIGDCSKNIIDCEGTAVFENCSFYGNGYKDPYYYAISTGKGGILTFSDCNFSDNMNPALVKNESACTFNNCTFSENAWDGGPSG